MGVRRSEFPETPDVSGPEMAVFVSGVASMGLEILAGRMIAPQFGSSIYTWGTIIGVFLAALSYGYWRGGKRAASDASERRMARVFLLTALYVALLIFAGDLLIRSTTGFPLPSRLASLPAVVLLFGPPTYLLGFVSPYAAELVESTSTGEASGHVYAVGTVGSIVGAFGTTYLLIPWLSVDLIGLVFGGLSVATAIALYGTPLNREPVFRSLGVGLLVVAAVATGVAGVGVEGVTVYETQTPYQELRVADRGEIRTLYLGGQRHSAMDKSDPTRHVFTYTRYFHASLLFTEEEVEDLDRVLFIGGGGFTGPRRFAAEYENVTVDAVELDPEVIDVAEEYFRLEESDRLNVYQGDGRRFLRQTDRTYDVVIVDAFQKDKVPFHMTTREFMSLASDRMDEDGVFYMNLIAAPSGPGSKFYRAEYRTAETVYPQVYAFPTVEAPVVQNVQLVATKHDEPVTREELREREARRDLGIDLSEEVEDVRRTNRTGDAPVLRDDRAPVDRLLDPMVGQEYVVAETGPNGSRTATPQASG